MPEITDSELRQFVQYQNLGTPGEVQKKITDLEKDNVSQRDKIRTLSEQVPKENEAVVPKEDAELLPKFKELGKDPKEIKAKLTKGEQAEREAAQAKREKAATTFVKAAGLHEDTVDTLVAIPALEGASFEVKKGKVKDDRGNETEQDIAYVTLPGDNQKALTFEEAKEQVPALKGLRTAEPVKPTGANRVQFYQQGGGDKGKAGTVFDKIRAEAESKSKPKADEPKVMSVEERLGMTRAQ